MLKFKLILVSDFSTGLVCAPTADAAGAVCQYTVGAFVCQDAYLAPDAHDHMEPDAVQQQQKQLQKF